MRTALLVLIVVTLAGCTAYPAYAPYPYEPVYGYRGYYYGYGYRPYYRPYYHHPYYWHQYP